MPVLLVCEEAHRFVPADERVGFAATTRAIKRIAREGRKIWHLFALISQRPSELSAQALSQCGTIFALRLTNELDQRFIETVLPGAARGNLRPYRAWVRKRQLFAAKASLYQCGSVSTICRAAVARAARALTSAVPGGLIQSIPISVMRECGVGAIRTVNRSRSSVLRWMIHRAPPS